MNIIYYQIWINFSKKEKRQVISSGQSKPTRSKITSFEVECLVVVDKSTKDFILGLYPNPAWIDDYINIVFTNIVQQVLKIHFS